MNRDIRKQGLEPRVEILSHAIPDQETALRVEAAAIDLLDVTALTNVVRGWKSTETGRASLEELVAVYQRRPIKIREPAVLIRISQKYHYGMGPIELYDATRSAWRIGPKRDRVELAFAIHSDVVREVYPVVSGFRLARPCVLIILLGWSMRGAGSLLGVLLGRRSVVGISTDMLGRSSSRGRRIRFGI